MKHFIKNIASFQHCAFLLSSVNGALFNQNVFIIARKIRGLNFLTMVEKRTYLLVTFHLSFPVWLPFTPIPHLQVSISQMMYVAVDVWQKRGP